MGITYKPLRHILIDRNLEMKDLRDKNGANLNSSTITRLNKDEYISLKSIEDICRFLNCRIEDVVEVIVVEGEDK